MAKNNGAQAQQEKDEVEKALRQATQKEKHEARYLERQKRPSTRSEPQGPERRDPTKKRMTGIYFSGKDDGGAKEEPEHGLEHGSDALEAARRRAHQQDSSAPRAKLQTTINADVLDRLRNAAYWTRFSLSDIVGHGTLLVLEALEEENGGPFQARTGKLTPGPSPR